MEHETLERSTSSCFSGFRQFYVVNRYFCLWIEWRDMLILLATPPLPHIPRHTKEEETSGFYVTLYLAFSQKLCNAHTKSVSWLWKWMNLDSCWLFKFFYFISNFVCVRSYFCISKVTKLFMIDFSVINIPHPSPVHISRNNDPFLLAFSSPLCLTDCVCLSLSSPLLPSIPLHLWHHGLQYLNHDSGLSFST